LKKSVGLLKTDPFLLIMMPATRSRLLAGNYGLIFALSLGLIHGLIYVFLMPVWQHYDEPNHFEYAWLIANRNRLPSPTENDLGMRREVALSMINSGFFRPLGFLPDVKSETVPAWIGPISQLNNPPLYYLMGAIPLKLLQSRGVDTQLIALRFLSLSLYLLTIFSAWGVARETTRTGHPLRFYLPITVALLPGFADVMTAVNSDAAAVAFISMCLWGCIRLVKRGLNWIDSLWCISTVILCLLSKETAYIALPLFALAIIFAIFRNRLRPIAWVLLGAGALIGGVFLFSTGDAASWYRSTSQSAATRQANPQAVDGKQVFSINTLAEITPLWSDPVFQPVPVFPQLQGGDHTYTLGAWMWASQPAQVKTPVLGDGHSIYSQWVDVGVEPAFFAYTATVIPQNDTRLWVSLDPGVKDQDIQVYYDGLVLVDQPVKVQGTPQFVNSDSTKVIWGGEELPNLLRNASAERSGLRVAWWVDQIGAKILPDHTRPSVILTYLLDWKGAFWQYRLTLERLLRTFWAQFSWGQITLLGHRPYRWLGIITIVSSIGFVIWGVRYYGRQKKYFPWDIVVLMAFMLVVVWGGAISRGVLYLGNNRLYLPVARYAYPAIVPTIMVFCLGAFEIFSWMRKWRRISDAIPNIQMVVWLGFFLFLDIYSIFSILTYYRGIGVY
jgi:hypothetical protein